MKYYYIIFILILSLSQTCIAQSTYYAPNNVNITLTIKEPYKPIDWGKFSNDFSNQLNAIAAKREAQKKYLDDILFETINSTHSSTQLTNDSEVNSCLLNLKTKIIDRLYSLNNLLKRGQITPNSYESSLRKTYFDYFGANQIFLNIVNYKSNSISYLSSLSEKNSFEDTFRNTIRSVTAFEVSDNSITFTLTGLVYPNNDINNLYQFVSNSCGGQYSNYKSRWIEEVNKQKRGDELKMATEKWWYERKSSNHQIWHNFKVEVIGSRRAYINQLNSEQQLEYFKQEKKAVFDALMSEYTWSLSTRKIMKTKVENYISLENQKNGYLDYIEQPLPLNILKALNNLLPNPYQILEVPKEILDNMEYVQ